MPIKYKRKDPELCEKRGPHYKELQDEVEYTIKEMLYEGHTIKNIKKKTGLTYYIIKKYNFIEDSKISHDLINLTRQMIIDNVDYNTIYKKTGLVGKQIRNIEENIVR